MALAFRLPTTVPLNRPSPRQGSTWLTVGQPVPARRREPGAQWKPRRWLLGLPALVDEHDLDRWLAWAAPGVEAGYHVGASLSAARLDDPALDLLARALLARSSADVLGVTAPPCGHLRALWRGSSDVHLVQRRCGPSSWLYSARRR